MSEETIWTKVAAPLPTSVIQWRIDGKPTARDGKHFARFVAYVDAQFVRQRLDEVVPGNWHLTLELLPPTDIVGQGGEVKGREFSFKARLNVAGTMREDVGTGDDYKSASTDAFKRAAVRLGIAHELYDYEQNWVEVDGEGKYAKPVEDPQKAYERRHVSGAKAITGAPPVSSKADSGENPKAGGVPAPIGAEAVRCPKCGGRTWDNRDTKRNPKAPDFKCQNRSCDGAIWPPKEGGDRLRANPPKAVKTPNSNEAFDDFPGALVDTADDLPF